ncbi:cell division protein FtsB [Thiohalobacter sp.]|uniref:cell division protein FtsB n=1 Tax=Thiohalobacter sp. TaxID=2025948 RepID=UPI00260269A3|nr:cell division protein FtsB [Thiohalobacter sp.]
MRWLIALLVALLIYLQYRLWVGDGSLAEVWRLRGAVAEQRAENARLQERNQALDAEVRDLKEGLEAVEERARSELGMIREGEVFYQIVEEPGAEPADD